MKRRKNQFREALDAKREALTRAANEPEPEKQPEWEPETPELRAEVLADRLEEREAELAKEQERRRADERKVPETSWRENRHLPKLRELRGALGLTQKELAHMTGLAESTISCYEIGKRRACPRIEKAFASPGPKDAREKRWEALL